MLFSLYSHLLNASTPLLEYYLQRRVKLGKEDPARAGERRGRASVARPDGFLVWAHAASVGESISLLPVVNALLRENPVIKILVTTGTVTSAKLMAKRLPDGVIHQYVPVDHPKWVARFLDHWKPDLALWTESEFWPHLLSGLHDRKIPAVLLNARLSERSFKRWMMFRKTASRLLDSFTFCLAQSKAEAARLIALGVYDVRVAGNLKYAADPLPYDAAAFAEVTKHIGDRPRLVWASTHEGEEKSAFLLHQKLLADYPDLLTIIVPRHPVRGKAIATMLSEAIGFKFGLRSQGAMPDPSMGIYVADTLGELGLFFRTSQLVVMGGSFADKGGHNPIEPAQLGCTVFFGPSRHNFLTIFGEFMAANAMIAVKSEEELSIAVKNTLKYPIPAKAVGDAARAWTSARSVVAEEVITALRPLLSQNKTQETAF